MARESEYRAGTSPPESRRTILWNIAGPVDEEGMEHATPNRNEILAKDRLVCGKCGRDALTLTADGLPLCARHATIFMTAKRLEERRAVESP